MRIISLLLGVVEESAIERAFDITRAMPEIDMKLFIELRRFRL